MLHLLSWKAGTANRSTRGARQGSVGKKTSQVPRAWALLSDGRAESFLQRSGSTGDRRDNSTRAGAAGAGAEGSKSLGRMRSQEDLKGLKASAEAQLEMFLKDLSRTGAEESAGPRS